MGYMRLYVHIYIGPLSLVNIIDFTQNLLYKLEFIKSFSVNL